MEENLIPTENFKENPAPLPKKTSVFSFVIFPLLLAVVFTVIAFLLSFFFDYYFTGAFSWAYGDIARDCGDWCSSPTAIGLILYFLYFTACTFFASWAVRRLAKKIKSEWAKNVFALILSIAISWAVLHGMLFIGPKMPKLPVAVRCASFLINPELTVEKPFGLDGSRAGCIFDIAKKQNSVDVCLRLEDDISQSYCVGELAKINNDVSLCDVFDRDYSKAWCVDRTLEDSSSELKSEGAAGGKGILQNPESLIASVRGDAGYRSYYPTGDVPSKPRILWTLEKANNDTDPIASGNAVLFGGYGIGEYGNDSNFGLYDGGGKLLWSLRDIIKDDYFWLVTATPTLYKGVLYLSDYDNLYAYDLAGNTKKWEAAIREIGNSPAIDGERIYIISDTQGSTGDPVVLNALDITTGKKMWAKPFGEGLQFVENNVALTSSSIVALGREMRGGSVLYIFNKNSGELKFELKESANEASFFGWPIIAGDNELYVRTLESILVLNEHTGKISKKFLFPGKITGDEVLAAAMAYHNNQLVFSDGDHTIISIDTRSGSVGWKANLEGAVTASPVLTKSYVYAGTNKKLYALDRMNGNIVWTFDLINPIGSNISASEGQIYFVSLGRRLNALK